MRVQYLSSGFLIWEGWRPLTDSGSGVFSTSGVAVSLYCSTVGSASCATGVLSCGGGHSTSTNCNVQVILTERQFRLSWILCELFSQVILMAANCPAILQLDFEWYWSWTLHDMTRQPCFSSALVFNKHFFTIRELTYSGMLVTVELLPSLLLNKFQL